MLEAKSAPLMAFKYSVCSGVQAVGPATLEVGIGSAESELPEHAVKVSASKEVVTISIFAEEVIVFTR